LQIRLGKKTITVDPYQSIMKGGEADIFQVDPQTVVKVYKGPDHPDHITQEEKQAAQFRLDEQQKKLPAFPKNLPPNVISPIEFAYVRDTIVGYSMKYIPNANTLMAYSDMNFKKVGITYADLVKILQNLHKSFDLLHKSKVVSGDANDLNDLVTGTDVWLIDADSYQFGNFLCYSFTTRFLDPLLSKPDELALIKPHNVNSDWYAFAIMVMNTLLSVGPYGGTHKPKKGEKRIHQDKRPLKRLTIFSPEIIYPLGFPKPDVLPLDLLDYLFKIFVEDLREDFPRKLLDMEWQVCKNCGTEHARNVCPECALVTPAAVKQKVVIRGKVKATTIFYTRGSILYATVQNDELKYLWQENGSILREGKKHVITGKPDPNYRYRIKGEKTFIGKNNQLAIIKDGGGIEKTINVDVFMGLPSFDTNEEHYFWIHAGNLYRDHDFAGYELIGKTIPNQALFWVGQDKGWGFYRAGRINISFIFNAKGQLFKDSVDPLEFSGLLVDSTCLFVQNRIWVLYTVQEKGVLKNRCLVYDNQTGHVIAQHEDIHGNDSWLGSIRGKCSAANRVFSTSPDGIVKLKVDGSNIIEEATFPDTSNFINSSSYLLISTTGLHVVSTQEIRTLVIS
jgi:hypothetical protein